MIAWLVFLGISVAVTGGLLLYGRRRTQRDMEAYATGSEDHPREWWRKEDLRAREVLLWEPPVGTQPRKARLRFRGFAKRLEKKGKAEL